MKLKRAHAVTNPDKSHKSIITKATKSFCMTSPLLPTTDRQSDATRTQIDSGSFDQLHQLLLRPPILDSDSSDNIAPPPLRISNVSHAPVVTQRHPMLGLTSVTNIECARVIVLHNVVCCSFRSLDMFSSRGRGNTLRRLLNSHMATRGQQWPSGGKKYTKISI